MHMFSSTSSLFGVCILIFYRSRICFSVRSEARASSWLEGLCLDVGLDFREGDIQQERPCFLSAPQTYTQAHCTHKCSHQQISKRRKGGSKQSEILIYKSKFKGIACCKRIALNKPLCFNSGRNFHNKEMRPHKVAKMATLLPPFLWFQTSPRGSFSKCSILDTAGRKISGSPTSTLASTVQCIQGRGDRLMEAGHGYQLTVI